MLSKLTDDSEGPRPRPSPSGWCMCDHKTPAVSHPHHTVLGCPSALPSGRRAMQSNGGGEVRFWGNAPGSRAANSLRERPRETLAYAQVSSPQAFTSFLPLGNAMKDVRLALVPSTLGQVLPLDSYWNILADNEAKHEGNKQGNSHTLLVLIKWVPSSVQSH